VTECMFFGCCVPVNGVWRME